MTGGRFSRRRFIQGGLALSATGVAGCANLGVPSGSQTAFSKTSVDGNQLVVQLQSKRDFSHVNLIAPDGNEFQSLSVDSGASEIRFPLFDFSSGQRYSPGEHEVVAIQDGEQVSSTTVELAPDLELVSVEQYSGGEDSPQNRANLLVTVENVGTGPTWIYYLAYEGAPNSTQTPREGHPRNSPSQAIEKPESEDETILTPKESQSFLSRWPPLRFSGNEHCRGMEIEFDLTVYSGVGENIKQPLRATLSGQRIQELYRETCSDISVEMVKDE